MSDSVSLVNLTAEEKVQARIGYDEALQYSMFYFREAIIPVALFTPLVTLYVSFMLFSTSSQRRSFIYWCLVLAFVLNAIQTSAYIRFAVLGYHQHDGSIALRLANNLHLFVPWIFEMALTGKVYQLYSFVPVCVPTCFLAIRAGLYSAIITCTQRGDTSKLKGLYLGEYILQFMTTTYCSSLLVIKAIRLHRAQVHKDDTPKEQKLTYLRVVIELTLMTFAPGVPISLALVVMWCLHMRYDTEKIKEAMKLLILINTYGGLLWALFAAQWSTIRDIRTLHVTEQSHRNPDMVYRNHAEEIPMHEMPRPKRTSRPQSSQNDIIEVVPESDATPTISLSENLAAQTPPRKTLKRMWLGRRPAIGPERSGLNWLTRPKEIKVTEEHEDMIKARSIGSKRRK
ncbi:uncharacterized protein FA14DRAFT_182516 [Meira miltonrushii]|uniref:Uncharacterized protein n=1 Tax=Meira miltonrushii TaxID=1280837 RepID=A0A316V8C1_9BASI|nr:uncharacterized protein FA14DRAFT_182516 [Meira miltonrushii]PWN31725.1 hypothetical protein FA14DRAFT_182516 [Meira miltonrushii]